MTDGPVLHIYAQFGPHHPATIVGTRTALEALGIGLIKASKDGRATVDTMAADGEGYMVLIIKRDAELGSDEWNRQRLPYVAEL